MQAVTHSGAKDLAVATLNEFAELATCATTRQQFSEWMFFIHRMYSNGNTDMVHLFGRFKCKLNLTQV